MDKENVVFIYRGDSFPVKDEMMSFSRKQMQLELIVLSETSQTQEDK